MDVFQQEPGLMDGCAEAILKAILKVLCIVCYQFNQTLWVQDD